MGASHAVCTCLGSNVQVTYDQARRMAVIQPGLLFETEKQAQARQREGGHGRGSMRKEMGETGEGKRKAERGGAQARHRVRRALIREGKARVAHARHEGGR